MKFLVVIERAIRVGALTYPTFPGCVAAADSREEVVKLIREAIDVHLEGMCENGEIPVLPSSEGELIEVGAA